MLIGKKKKKKKPINEHESYIKKGQLYPIEGETHGGEKDFSKRFLCSRKKHKVFTF
jgi:hypothetical protein